MLQMKRQSQVQRVLVTLHSLARQLFSKAIYNKWATPDVKFDRLRRIFFFFFKVLQFRLTNSQIEKWGNKQCVHALQCNNTIKASLWHVLKRYLRRLKLIIFIFIHSESFCWYLILLPNEDVCRRKRALVCSGFSNTSRIRTPSEDLLCA